VPTEVSCSGVCRTEKTVFPRACVFFGGQEDTSWEISEHVGSQAGKSELLASSGMADT
jgi:hypothetical protein